MPTILATKVIEDVASAIVDEGHNRWTNSELLSYLNAAQLEIANKRPDSSVTTTTFECVAEAKQTLPSTGLRLIEVIGNTGGEAITLVDRAVLDEQIPNWRNSTATAIAHYVYDDRDPHTFYVYPVPAVDHSIDVTYSIAPATIEIADADFGSAQDIISIDDIYLTPMIEYMLYRCFIKDAENQSYAARARGHLQAFSIAIGEKTQADSAVSPNTVSPQNG